MQQKGIGNGNIKNKHCCLFETIETCNNCLTDILKKEEERFDPTVVIEWPEWLEEFHKHQRGDN